MLFIIDDKIPYIKGVLEPFANVEYYKGSLITKKIIENADALVIRSRTICNRELLENTKVKFIATATIGFDHIDTEFCDSNGIKWTNAPGCNSGSVMQYIVSALIRLSIKYNFNLSEKALGIIGYGNVGSKVGKAASLLGMKVLINDPPLKRKGELNCSISINEICKKADIITFHVPLNMKGIDKTYQIVDDQFLKCLKPETFLINSSRGEVVKEVALKNALKNKTIKGAILDVWENEPKIDVDLLHLVDYATPHIAGYSADGKANGTAISVQSISDYFELGLKNWFPSSIPKPQNQKITIERKVKTEKEILNSVILATYDILQDDQQLRNSVMTFEEQRENYPNRREFSSFIVKIDPNISGLVEKLKGIGFNTI